MTKPGHEAPLNDNQRSANLGAGDPSDDQIRIGQTPEASEPKTPDDPMESLLTDKERERVDKLVESGQMNRLEAIMHTTTTVKARRIIGHTLAAEQAAKHQKGIEERTQADAAAKQGPTTEELAELIREVPNTPSDNSTN